MYHYKKIMFKIILKLIRFLTSFDSLKLLFYGLPIALILRLISKFFNKNDVCKF